MMMEKFWRKFPCRWCKLVPTYLEQLIESVIDQVTKKWLQTLYYEDTKAELLQEGIIFLIHLFARAILLMNKHERDFVQ